MDSPTLSRLEYLALSDILYVDAFTLRNIYKKFGIDGIAMIALNNMFFVKSKNVVGCVDDLKNIADSYLKDGERRIVDYFLNSRFFTLYHKFYYSQTQLSLLNYNMDKVYRGERIYHCNSDRVKENYPDTKKYNRTFFEAALYMIRKKLNYKLPDHLYQLLKHEHRTLFGINVELCFRLINFYLSLDSSFIGFKKFIDIELDVAGKKHEKLIRLINKTRAFVYDDVNNIIYDRKLREEKGLSPVPAKEEINRSFDVRPYRFLNILNIK